MIAPGESRFQNFVNSFSRFTQLSLSNLFTQSNTKNRIFFFQ